MRSGSHGPPVLPAQLASWPWKEGQQTQTTFPTVKVNKNRFVARGDISQRHRRPTPAMKLVSGLVVLLAVHALSQKASILSENGDVVIDGRAGGLTLYEA
jgi:hypothetical protein